MLSYIQFPSWISHEVIPGLPIRWYSIMYFVAFGITFFLFKKQRKEDSRIQISDDSMYSLFFWLILGLILGARLFSTLFYTPGGYYWRNPWMIFLPFNANWKFVGYQGMSYHGGLVGAIVAGLIYCKKEKLSFFEMADLVAAGVPLGYTFGRIGNFINGELWGRVTTAPFGIVFPHAPSFSTTKAWVRGVADSVGMPYTMGDMVNLPRHPSQLYEALFEGVVLWLILWFIVRKRKTFHGAVLSLYIVGYGIARFLIEYFREPDSDLGFILEWGAESYPAALFLSPLNISMGQVFSFLMIVGGLALYFICKRFGSKVEPLAKIKTS